ncbi:MAG: DUF1572 family protein [Verrucomicrobiota bacterium]
MIGESTAEFRRLKRLAESAVDQLTDLEFFRSAQDSDNSIAIIYKHMSGNMVSRWTDFLSSDGEKASRRRDEEFQILEDDSIQSIKANWEAGWGVMFETLSSLSESDLGKIVTIRGKPLAVSEAIIRQVGHYSYHIGQIVFIAKTIRGSDWISLSIPTGKSAEYNRSLGYEK